MEPKNLTQNDRILELELKSYINDKITKVEKDIIRLQTITIVIIPILNFLAGKYL